MQIIKTMVLCGGLLMAGCSSWVYKIDIPQGNYLEQQAVDKLRVQMSREQVEYILGTPVLKSLFNQDKWHYVYTIAKNKTDNLRYELVIHFENDRVADMSGDFKRPAEFDTPLDL